MNILAIIEYLCNQFDSKEYEKDILKYGLEVLFYNALTFLILFSLSLIFKNLNFGLIFIPIFSLLRITIGGFHCKTIFGCTFLMITIYTLINLLVSLSVYKYLLTFFAPVLIFILFFIKQCNENTIHFKNYNIYVKNILIFSFIIFFICSFNTTFFVPIFSALFITEVMYFAYFIKN